MNHPGKVFLTLTAALLLLCPQIFAQEPSGEAAPPPAEQTDRDEDTNQLLQQFEKAPTLEGGTQKLYHIRNVNIHGAQYIDNSILRASSGLIPGDSIYLPSNFISTAITRLWNQRLFSDIRVGATIEGDSLDLEVFPEGTSPRQLLAFRGHLQKQPERPARKAQTQARHRAFGLRDRQELEAHSQILRRQRFPQRRSIGPHRQRLDTEAGRKRDLHRRSQT